jgi:uncharacterized protein YjiS (DUF1127 family)
MATRTCDFEFRSAPANEAPGRRAASLIARTIETLAVWRERRRERRALGALDDTLLKDIGISRADAYDEVRKPFWCA